jgi:hypothetical protein
MPRYDWTEVSANMFDKDPGDCNDYRSPLNTTAAIDDALAGRLGKQPATERQKLEEAIHYAIGACSSYDYRVGEFRLVIEAARKHLETLPKPKTMWRLSYVTPNGLFDYRHFPSEQTALDSALLRLRTGCSGVGIVTIEVA